MKGQIYVHTLDIIAFTAGAIPPHLEHFLFAEDSAQSIDLSCILFRMQRAIGGAWTEYLHKKTRPPVHPPRTLFVLPVFPHVSVLQEWRRHTAIICMAFIETESYITEIYDSVEAELARFN